MNETYKKLLNEVEKDYQQLGKEKVLIVDGLNTFIRSWTVNPTMDDNGDHIGGIVGTLKGIGYAIREYNATRCIIVFDGKGGSKSRKDLYSGYKENRGNNRFRVNRAYSDLMKKEEEALNVKSKKVKDITKCVNNDLNMNNKDIFATLKSYKTEDKPSAKQIVNQMGIKPLATDKPLSATDKQPVKNQFSNTFIRIGKTCEYNIIQKPPDKNIAIVNSILFGENNIGKTIDFFDTLEISDTVNPFTSQNNVEDNVDLSVLKKTNVAAESATPKLATESATPDLTTESATPDLTTESTPINVEALSKAKSWKEFKSLSSRR